jgi:hypothetical protein
MAGGNVLQASWRTGTIANTDLELTKAEFKVNFADKFLEC